MVTRAAEDRRPAGTDGGSDPAVPELVAEPYADLAETRQRLRALLGAFEARGDRRADFLTVYVRTTEAVADRIRRGAFTDPEWVAEYLVTFANHYREAVRAHETGDHDSLPTPWRLAFEAAERGGTSTVQNAALGVNAHINYDLALALDEVGIDGDRAARYADHSAVTDVIMGIVEEVWTDLATREVENGGTPRRRLDPVDAGFAVRAIDECRDSAWRTAVALSSRFRTRRRAARWLNGVTATAGARVVLGTDTDEREHETDVTRRAAGRDEEQDRPRQFASVASGSREPDSSRPQAAP